MAQALVRVVLEQQVNLFDEVVGEVGNHLLRLDVTDAHTEADIIEEPVGLAVRVERTHQFGEEVGFAEVVESVLQLSTFSLVVAAELLDAVVLQFRDD